MKYPCNLIRDLLPLYLDHVCSRESEEIVKEHLESCPECTAYFHSMEAADREIGERIPCDSQSEVQKASSFRAVKKRIQHRQIMAALLSALVLITAAISGIGILKKTTRVVPYGENLSVSMVDGNLVGRLYGSEYSGMRSKSIWINRDGRELRYVLYCVADTIWDDIRTGENTFSEYVICPKEKGADGVDRVYYYTGSYEALETMSEEEIGAVIADAGLLWEKENESSIIR